MFADVLTVVKGGGDLATGVIYRLRRAGFPVIVTEIAQPTVVRRSVALAEAVYDGETTVEGMRARRVEDANTSLAALEAGLVPVLVDPRARIVQQLQPTVVVDAIIAKRNTGTRPTDAPIVVGLGPGFVAGQDVHAVIETNRGHYLGRVIWEGAAEPDTGVPGIVGGQGARRVLRAPVAGTIRWQRAIGDRVAEGDVLGTVTPSPPGEERAVVAPFDGVLRGAIHDGLRVSAGMKIGDVDPRAIREHCFSISDKALAIGGGVLEAVLFLLGRMRAGG